jgi:hypothetical protein
MHAETAVVWITFFELYMGNPDMPQDNAIESVLCFSLDGK